MDKNNYNIWQKKITNQELLEKEEGGVIYSPKGSRRKEHELCGRRQGSSNLVGGAHLTQNPTFYPHKLPMAVCAHSANYSWMKAELGAKNQPEFHKTLHQNKENNRMRHYCTGRG